MQPQGRTSGALIDPMTSPDLRQQLERLYGSHFGKIAGYFRRRGQTEAVAHELAQETFVNALRGLRGFKGGSKLSTWLWSIAHNVLLAHVRSPASREPQGGDEPVDPDSLMSPPDRHLSGMDDCVRRGFAAFAAEHPERAQVIYLAVVEGWTREELASHLGRTVHAATEYLSQCKARLRPYIEHCHGD
jgi:RNA polymerase sigma factor (sigma-70 family)